MHVFFFPEHELYGLVCWNPRGHEVEDSLEINKNVGGTGSSRKSQVGRLVG
jgi:hypothetical protein